MQLYAKNTFVQCEYTKMDTSYYCKYFEDLKAAKDPHSYRLSKHMHLEHKLTEEDV